MQIKEVQEKLKISSYTLRYYEKMGLIQPYRDENGYRNYSEEDIHKIERIMFLRDINVPIEDVQLCGRRHPGAESQRVIPAQTPGQTRCRKPRHGKCKTCFGGVL